MHFTSILSIILLGVFGAQAAKPCSDYEIGVGTTQTCGAATGCGGTFSVVTTSNCSNDMGTSWSSNLCATDYSNGWKVSCSGGNPSVVSASNGQRWGNCYKPSNGWCGVTSGVSSIYENVYWCCKQI